jgi:hypothetical protein
MTALLGGLAVLTLWGFVAPRSQWRVLTSWSHRDPRGNEPGQVVVGIHRVVAGLAVASLAFTGVSIEQGSKQPKAVPVVRSTADPVRQLWGTPDPVVVNRVISPVTAAPTNLVSLPVLRFQGIDGTHRDPSYPFNLGTFQPPHAKKGDGYVGSDPAVGLTALDTANLVVQVRADARCIPKQVLVLQSASAVVVAVYYGRPGGEVTNGADLATLCNAPASGSVSTLIPLHLDAPVGSRAVVNLDGVPVAPAVSKN